MSLINEALKKAHKDAHRREGVNSGQSSTHAKSKTGRESNSGSPKWIGIVTLIVAVGCAGLILVAQFPNADIQSLIASLKGESQLPEAPAKSIQDSKFTKKSPIVATEQTSPPSEKITSLPKPGSNPMKEKAPSPQTSATSTASKIFSAAEMVTQKPDTATVAQDAAILKAVYELKIDAVIGHGKTARIMISGQVYRIGAMLDFTLRYKFAGEENGLLLFRDENGVIYERYI